MPTPTDAVKKAGRRLMRAQEARDRAMRELLDEVKAAHANGVPKNELVRVSGLARQTVFDALKDPTSTP